MSEEPVNQPTRDSKRPRWITATGAGLIATLVAAIATLISSLTPLFDDDTPTSQAPPGTTTSQESANPDPPTRLLYRAAFARAVTGWNVGAQNGDACSANFESAGYELVVLGRRREGGLFPYCVYATDRIDGLTALPTVRVEVDAAFTQLPPMGVRGAGEILVRCRGRATPGPADTSYYAGITTNGAWSFSRTEGGVPIFLTRDARQDLAFTEGQYRRLRLDCLAQSGGEVRPVFYVDGELVGTFTDASPPPAGDIGLGVAAAQKGKLAVAFRELVIRGP